MPIKYGKGIKGALGKLGTLGDTYVPLPFKEMLIGNQMKQASYDKSEATLDEISSLYDENFIDKDSAILDQQEEGLNASIEEMIQSAGGDLGKLTGKFTNLYRKTASDKTYRNATAQQANRVAFAEELRKAKLDPGMAQYYLNQADEAYPGADKGQYSGVNYSNLTETKVNKALRDVGKSVTKTSVQRPVKDYADLNGNPISAENAMYLGDGNYVISGERLRTVEQRDVNTVYNDLMAEIGSTPSIQQFMVDHANMLGIDPNKYISDKVTSIAQSLSGVSKDHLGKSSALPGANETEDTNDVPSSVNMSIDNVTHPLSGTGYLDIPGGSVVDSRNAVQNDPDLSPDMKTYLNSIYDAAAMEIYPDDADMGASYWDGSMFDVAGAKTKHIEEGLKGAGEELIAFVDQYRDGEGALNLQSLIEAGLQRFPASTQDERRGLRGLGTPLDESIHQLLGEARTLGNQMEKNLQVKNEAFAARVAELKTNSPEVKMLEPTMLESKKTVEIVSALIESGTATAYTKDGTKVNLQGAGLENARVVEVAMHPIVTGLSENDQVRVLNISGKIGKGVNGKVKQYQLRIPEEAFQAALGTDKTISLFKGTEVENYSPGIISTKLQMLSTGMTGTMGLSSENELLRRAINQRFSQNSGGNELEIMPPGSINIKVAKTPQGFVFEGSFMINGVEEKYESVPLANIQSADGHYEDLVDIIYKALNVK